MFCGRELVLAIAQKRFQAQYPIIPSDQLPFRNGDLFLEAAILLHQLPLHVRKLFEIPL